MKTLIRILTAWCAPQRNAELDALINSARAISRDIEIKHKGK